MIVAKFEELAGQMPASANIEKGLAYLASARVQDLPDGRYEVDGERVYALVQSYQTLPEDENAKYEAHRRYIDIQYIVSGVEGMGWAPLEQMQVNKEYSPEKDILLGACPISRATLVQVNAGEAAVFFPGDAHAPKLACGAPGPVKKIVVKVAV